MSDIINVTKCDIIEIISEGHRYLIHIILVAFVTNLINGTTENMFNTTLLKTLLATALSIIIYHVILKRVIEPKLKKLKKICEGE